MIKLKELIELKSMVYSEEIKPKHKKKMNRSTPSFHEGIVLPKIQPPDNDSRVTVSELIELSCMLSPSTQSLDKCEWFTLPLTNSLLLTEFSAR